MNQPTDANESTTKLTGNAARVSELARELAPLAERPAEDIPFMKLVDELVQVNRERRIRAEEVRKLQEEVLLLQETRNRLEREVQEAEAAIPGPEDGRVAMQRILGRLDAIEKRVRSDAFFNDFVDTAIGVQEAGYNKTHNAILLFDVMQKSFDAASQNDWLTRLQLPSVRLEFFERTMKDVLSAHGLSIAQRGGSVGVFHDAKLGVPPHAEGFEMLRPFIEYMFDNPPRIDYEKPVRPQVEQYYLKHGEIIASRLGGPWPETRADAMIHNPFVGGENEIEPWIKYDFRRGDGLSDRAMDLAMNYESAVGKLGEYVTSSNISARPDDFRGVAKYENYYGLWAFSEETFSAIRRLCEHYSVPVPEYTWSTKRAPEGEITSLADHIREMGREVPERLEPYHPEDIKYHKDYKYNRG